MAKNINGIHGSTIDTATLGSDSSFTIDDDLGAGGGMALGLGPLGENAGNEVLPDYGQLVQVLLHPVGGAAFPDDAVGPATVSPPAGGISNDLAALPGASSQNFDNPTSSFNSNPVDVGFSPAAAPDTK